MAGIRPVCVSIIINIGHMQEHNLPFPRSLMIEKRSLPVYSRPYVEKEPSMNLKKASHVSFFSLSIDAPPPPAKPEIAGAGSRQGKMLQGCGRVSRFEMARIDGKNLGRIMDFFPSFRASARHNKRTKESFCYRVTFKKTVKALSSSSPQSNQEKALSSIPCRPRASWAGISFNKASFAL